MWAPPSNGAPSNGAPSNGAPFNAPLHNVPLHGLIPKLPRDFPYQPEPKGWSLYVAWESSDSAYGLTVSYAEGRLKQTAKPGIKPCTRETIKNDRYAEGGTFTLHCDASGHETIVHKCVVLDQSKWLRDRVDPSTSHDSVPVHIPRQFKYWHVLWALEYMYEGRVPGFHLLAGDEWPTRCAYFQPRSIASGLLELWEVADFFGLGGLKQRAEGAFADYFIYAIPQAVHIRHCALGMGESEDRASGGRNSSRPEGRVAFEFREAAWRIFGDPSTLPKDYFELYMSEHEYTNFTDQIAQDLQAIWEWETATFDKIEAPGDGPPDVGPVPRYRATFRTIMMQMCPWLIDRGMGRLQWFQRFLSPSQFSYCSAEFRNALKERMGVSAVQDLTSTPARPSRSRGSTQAPNGQQQ